MKNEINEEEFIEAYKDGLTYPELGDKFAVSARTVERWAQKYRSKGKIPYKNELPLDLPLERTKQQNRDLGRIDRKTLREYLRLENAMKEYNNNLVATIKKYLTLPAGMIKTKPSGLVDNGIGVFHFTDPHFNELIDLDFNRYDFPISSQRCKKLVADAKGYFKFKGIKKIVFAMTGDLLNSDRRLDELLSEATNRSKATFIAFSILEHMILDLAQDFEVTVVSVIGNESRICKDVGWTEAVASDNYDYTIYNILKIAFRKNNVNFISVKNSIEQVVNINGLKVLFIHGNQIGGKSENKVQSIKGKYTGRNELINFIIFGDKHACRIGDTYARGSSLAGGNGYSDSALELESRASQNVHIIYSNGNRDSIKIDLQNVDGIKGYPIKKELEEYNAKSVDKAKKKTVISRIVI